MKLTKGAVVEGGTSLNYKTGNWRDQRPEIDYELCNQCGKCREVCPDDAVRHNDDRYEIDYDFCKGCGICAHECPADAIPDAIVCDLTGMDISRLFLTHRRQPTLSIPAFIRSLRETIVTRLAERLLGELAPGFLTQLGFTSEDIDAVRATREATVKEGKERLPVIVTGRADVVFGATSDTLERARTVGFSIPYAIYYAQGVVGKDTGITSFDDIRGKRVAAAVGALPRAHPAGTRGGRARPGRARRRTRSRFPDRARSVHALETEGRVELLGDGGAADVHVVGVGGVGQRLGQRGREHPVGVRAVALEVHHRHLRQREEGYSQHHRSPPIC